MSANPVQAEKSFASALISILSGQQQTPTEEEVREKAKMLAGMMSFAGDLDHVIQTAMTAIDTRMGEGVSIVDFEAEHDADWVYKREIPSTYTDAYSAFLREEGWPASVVQSLSDVGTKILGHLQDPESDGSWDRRGLVIGHVQSGKTANYMGVIAKAADAGYKFVIVIAGIHNNLRKQTQERIDEGFIGRSSDPENRVSIGVGLYDRNYPGAATLTNINEDFNKHTAAKSGWKINDFSKPVILVIKKNVPTLKALHKWLKDLNAQGSGKISDIPMLMIDDEADNASINTNKPDLDPTKTNSWIRQIVGLFDKSCYVGYTATPFANIFINPDAYDKEALEELFPRDFIYCLDAPTTYFGPDKVFLDEESSDLALERIKDCERYIPQSHKSDYTVPDLPPSLYQAIDEFIVARAIRNIRRQKNKHCSMLINVSRFVAVQRGVRDLVSLYESAMRQAVKANYAMPEKTSQRNKYMASLRAAYDSQYADCGASWEEVKAALWSVFDNLRLYVVNSKSDEPLDYKKYERDGHGLTAITIGGLSLSRGLTVEGLTVSYMYRNTRMYDTLMQMGRWFGYRPGYEDLCRVHLPKESIDWYSHIAEKSEELRQQIRRMRRDKLTPRQFGLYVEAHPDKLLITAANKMRAGEKLRVKQNFSGQLIESYLLPTDSEINKDNEALITEFWKNGFGGKIEPTKKGWDVKDVPVAVIEDFLTRFRAAPDFAGRKGDVVSYLQLLTPEHPVADVVLVSVAANDEDESAFRLGYQERARSDNKAIWHLSRERVASRGDEKLGLSDAQVEEATRNAAKDDKKPSDYHFREVRNKPLLMIHMLKSKDESALRVPAFGISFPPGHYEKAIDVVANKVWIDNMLGPVSDSPDEEDDFDE